MCGAAARAQRNAGEIDVEAGLEVVGRHPVERDRAVDRRHVDEHVEAAELGDRGGDERVALVGAGQVRLADDRRRRPARTASAVASASARDPCS